MTTAAIAIAKIDFQAELAACQAQLTACQLELAAEKAENQLYLDELDFIARIVQIPALNMSPQDKLLYIASVEAYPALISEESTNLPIVDFSVRRVREGAGGASKNAAGNFMRAMTEAGAWGYESGSWDGEDRIGSITPHSLFLMPEDVNLKSAEARKKARERAAEEAKRLRQNLLLDGCEECASPELLYDLIPHCKSCEHVHDAIRDVPASAIKVVEEVELEQDPLSRLLAQPCQAAPIGAIVETEIIETSSMTTMDMLDFITADEISQDVPGVVHPHGSFCPECGSPNAWRAIPTSYGSTIFVCALCYPAADLPPEGNRKL